jgi:hypothetical protein
MDGRGLSKRTGLPMSKKTVYLETSVISYLTAAAAHGIPYLATWNCTHINNAALKKKISGEISKAGYAEVTMAATTRKSINFHRIEFKS